MRITLTDGTGRWFDVEKAERWEEGRYFDGRNMISKATGSQWKHEALYRTSSGRWIIHWLSDYQGVADRWVEVSAEEAAEWLIRNGHEPRFSALP